MATSSTSSSSAAAAVLGQSNEELSHATQLDTICSSHSSNLKRIGALDFLPKAGYDELADMVDKNTVAFAYWGAIIAVTSDVSQLPVGVRVVDNLSENVYLLHMDLGAAPIPISRGPMPAVSSEAEQSENYQGELPWFHVCVKHHVRVRMVRKLSALSRTPGFKEVYICPSVAAPHEVMVVATRT